MSTMFTPLTVAARSLAVRVSRVAWLQKALETGRTGRGFGFLLAEK